MNNFIRPCRPHNSIETMGLIIYFKSELENLNDVFGKIESGKIPLSIFNKVFVLREDESNDGDVRKVRLHKEDSRGAKEWVASISTKGIWLFHKDYRRWNATMEVCMEALRSFGPLFEDQEIERLFLGYYDKFIVSEDYDFEREIPGALFKRCKQLPEAFFDSYLATADLAYYGNNITEDFSPGRFNLKIQTEPTFENDKLTTHVVTVDTNVSCHFRDDLLYTSFIEEGGEFEEASNNAHQALKDLFRDILDDSLLSMVGIEAQGE